MTTKGLLIIITVILIGIFSVVLLQATEKTPSEQVLDSVTNVADNVGDTID